MKKPYPRAILAVKPSRLLKGEVGLFALRPLPKGALVAEAVNFDESVFIPWSDFRRLDSLTRKRLKMFCWQSAKGIHAPHNINQLSIPWHINHSCDPNTFMDADGNYRALRKVKGGEELTIDIGTIMTDPKYRLHCRCGLPNCIGIIRARNAAGTDRELSGD